MNLNIIKKNIDAWQEAIDNVSYKDNFRFDLVEKPFGLILEINVKTIDTFNPGREIIVKHRYNLPPLEMLFDLTEKFKQEFIWKCIWQTESHEAQEWFRYKGEMVYNPHKDG